MKSRILLAPLLALSVLGAAPTLPEIPASVYSRYGPVPVDLVTQVVCPDSTGKTDPRVIGCFGGATRRIQIADTLSLWWQHLVLGHEQCHVALRDVNLHFDHQEDEEHVCWAVGRYRLGELEGHP